MNKKINPAIFDLPARTVLLAGDHENQLIMIIKRQSRIIMADGRRIIAKAEKIRAHNSAYQINLATTAPICSKTRNYLADHDIKIIGF